MKKHLWGALLIFSAGCSTSTPEVRRLSPVWVKTAPPVVCRIITVIHDSPAEKATTTDHNAVVNTRLAVGDTIHAVNGKTPADASAVAELVGQSPVDMTLAVNPAAFNSNTTQTLQIHLNDHAPRLGAVCDLTGWQKLGVTAAGNESLTQFNGPFAITASGIVDKGLVFLRARVSNNSDHPVAVTRATFTAIDGSQRPLLQMSPIQVMCFLYGEKGAHLLALKRRRNETLDASGAPSAAEESCAGVPTTGRVPEADNQQFADANAEYIAQESLWPATVASGAAADGLIYFPEPSALPLTLTAQVETSTFTIALGTPQARQQTNNEADLVQYFSSQTKGSAIRVTLKKGKVYVMKFQSYDADNERVWFYDSSNGLLNSISYPVSSIRAAEPLEDVPAKPQPTLN